MMSSNVYESCEEEQGWRISWQHDVARCPLWCVQQKPVKKIKKDVKDVSLLRLNHRHSAQWVPYGTQHTVRLPPYHPRRGIGSGAAAVQLGLFHRTARSDHMALARRCNEATPDSYRTVCTRQLWFLAARGLFEVIHKCGAELGGFIEP